MNPRIAAWFLVPLLLGCTGTRQSNESKSFPHPDANFVADLPSISAQIEGIERGVVTITDPEAHEFATIDRRPCVIQRSMPDYPKDLLANQVSGSVAVTFLVDKQGVTRSVSAERGSDPRFVDAVVQTVAKWKYRPAKLGGQSIAWRMRALIEFKIPEKKEAEPSATDNPDDAQRLREDH